MVGHWQWVNDAQTAVDHDDHTAAWITLAKQDITSGYVSPTHLVL